MFQDSSLGYADLIMLLLQEQTIMPYVDSILTVRLATTLFLCEEYTACVRGRVT